MRCPVGKTFGRIHKHSTLLTVILYDQLTSFMMLGKVFYKVSGRVNTFANKFTTPVRAAEILGSAVRLENERALVCRSICLSFVVCVLPVLLQFGPRPKIGVAVYTAHYYY